MFDEDSDGAAVWWVDDGEDDSLGGDDGDDEAGGVDDVGGGVGVGVGAGGKVTIGFGTTGGRDGMCFGGDITCFRSDVVLVTTEFSVFTGWSWSVRALVCGAFATPMTHASIAHTSSVA